MARRFNRNDYRAIAFSLISTYVLLATVVAVQAVEYARAASGGNLLIRAFWVLAYLNPVRILSSL